MKNNIRETLKDIIINCAQKNITKDEITDQTLLIDDLNFDSISIMKLIVDIEAKFKLVFSDQFLLIDNISNVGILTDYIYTLEEKKNA